MTQSDARERLACVNAQLDGWREQGLDQHDALRFQAMTALAERASRGSAVLQARLLERLETLAADYGRKLSSMTALDEGVEAPLAALRDKHSLSSSALCGPLSVLVGDMTARVRASGREPGQPDQDMLDYFRDLGVQIRIARQARQALEQAPANAGPLNSAFLAYRALTLMHQQSPGYLRRFLTYMDTLASLERPAVVRPKAGRRG